MIVVDTNVIGYLYLNSNYSEIVERAYNKDPHWAAPILWRSELRNVLALYMKKQLLSLEDAIDIMNEAMSIMHGGEYEIISLRVLQLAAQSSCSAYDCEFVALAQDLNVPLLTMDQQLLKEFPGLSISLKEFIS